MQQVDVEHPLFVPRQRRGAKPFTRQHVHVEHRVRISRRDRVRRSLLRGINEATSQGNSRSVPVAEYGADAIATSCPASSDPSLSDSAEPPPAWPTAPA